MPALHTWDLTPKEAVALQRHLAGQVRTDLKLDCPRRIAGVDVAYLPKSKESIATAVVLQWSPSASDASAGVQPRPASGGGGPRTSAGRGSGWPVVEWTSARIPTPFPYVPGLLSFREAPAILAAFEKLKQQPELVFVDGHGLAHPRRFGIACHLGLWLRIPTIGIGKSRLCGEFPPAGDEKGACSPLTHRGECIGMVLRSRTSVRPIFVSVGYGLPLDVCVRWTLRVTPRYRLPEPIRQAHGHAEASKRSTESGPAGR